MRKIKVKYIGIIRQHVTGKKREEEVDIREGATLGDLIDFLCMQYGERFKYTLLMRDDSISHIIRVIVDDVEVYDLGASLDKKKRIVIAVPFPFPGGGCGFQGVPGSGCKPLAAESN